jgi:hypothetical protein
MAGIQTQHWPEDKQGDEAACAACVRALQEQAATIARRQVEERRSLSNKRLDIAPDIVKPLGANKLGHGPVWRS